VAPDGGPYTFALNDLAVEGAVVTYVKGDLRAGDAGLDDAAGFFVQNDDTGPALYLAIDPAPLGLAVGDVVDFTARTGAWLSCGTSGNTCTETSSIYGVVDATVTVTGHGAALPAGQDPSASFNRTINAGDPAAMTGQGWVYDSERTTIPGSIHSSGSPTSPLWTAEARNANFVEAKLQPASNPSSYTSKLRMPAALADQLGLVETCQVGVAGTPMWSFNGLQLVTAWQPDDLTWSCPALTASLAWPSAALSVQPAATLGAISVGFSSPMDEDSLSAQVAPGPCTGSLQVSSDGFASCVVFAGPPTLGARANLDHALATLTPAAELLPSTTYEVKVTAQATARNGNALATDQVLGSFTTASAVCDAPVGGPPAPGTVVISRIFGAGGATTQPTAAFTNDFVELHNRGGVAVDLAGLTLQYASASGSTWSASNIFALSGTLPPGGYFLIQSKGGTAGTALPAPDLNLGNTPDLSAAAGKLALVSGTAALTGACPLTDARIVDFVGFGSTNCTQGTTNMPSLGNAKIAVRNGGGCSDANVDTTDFAVVDTSGATPTPPNTSQSAPLSCACAGSPTP
jgi:hypothetical protein